MILHHLHHPSLYGQCVALLSEHDTLLLLDEAVDTAFISTLDQLPCAVRILKSATNRSEAETFGVQCITVDEWVDLVIAHRHSMTWG